MSKVISICNQKGGVGKTTTAINLAFFLAQKEKKTLLIDFDPQGNTTSGLGIDKNKVEKSIYEALFNRITINDTVYDTALSNLKLVPSNISLAGSEIELVNLDGREYKLKESLNNIKDSFDFIVIDSPPSLGLLTINALAASDSTLIPIQCEYYALEGLTQLLNTIELVKTNLNPGLQIEGILLTMADFRTNLTQEVIDEARTFFKEKVFQTIIPRSIRISESPGFGKPIFLYDKDSIGALRYLELTNEILGEKPLDRVEVKTEPTQNFSEAKE